MSIGQKFEFVIQWHLTERCNLSCSHCYQDGTRQEELSSDEVRSVIEEIKDLFSTWSEIHGLTFVPSFNITGGEPLLRDDLFDILGDIADHGWDSFLLTNGTLVNAQVARRLARLGVKGVQVSLEGPESTHDAFRGAGSYRASLSGIHALLNEGVAVTVNTTLSEMNADRFFELAGIVSQLSVQRLGFSRLVPSGKGEALAERMLTPDRVRNLYSRIGSLSFRNMKLVTGDPVAACMRATADGCDDQAAVPIGGCAAGVSGLTILSDGTIVPCRRLPIPLGNVKIDSIREVWATSPVLDALRTRACYEGKCGTCKRWAVCRGCRAIAFAWSSSRGESNYLSDDPQCFLQA
jgi:radical SAM protein with 4Fe4S-binding SPASM domain